MSYVLAGITFDICEKAYFSRYISWKENCINGAELKVLLLIPSIIQVAQSQNELPAVLNLTPANLLASYIQLHLIYSN